MILGALVLSALANPPWTNAELAKGLLMESVDGDLSAAAQQYERVLEELADDDPLRGEILYRLGSARYHLGDDEAATAALLLGANRPGERGRCMELLDRIALSRASVEGVPADLSGASLASKLVHPWYYQDKGTLGVEHTAHNAVQWATVVDKRKADEIWLSARTAAQPIGAFALTAHATNFPTFLRVVVVDEEGRRYGLNADPPVWIIEVGEDATLKVSLADLVPIDTSTKAAPIQRVDRIVLQDATLFYSNDHGANRVIIQRVQLEP